MRAVDVSWEFAKSRLAVGDKADILAHALNEVADMLLGYCETVPSGTTIQ